MKKHASVILTFLLLCTSAVVFAQTPADDITGKWETANKARIIDITKDGDAYKGTIAEDKNEKLPAGTVFLKAVQYQSGSTYSGKMVAPKAGREIPCTITLTDKNTLSVKVSAGPRSRTLEWKRI